MSAAIGRDPGGRRLPPGHAEELAELFVMVARARSWPAAGREVGDPWMLAALAGVESNFREGALEDAGAGPGSGPGVGLLQLHWRHHLRGCALSVPCAVRTAAATLWGERGWYAHHAAHCAGKKPHHPLAHWFAGTNAENACGAAASAAKVLARRARLWESAHEVD